MPLKGVEEEVGGEGKCNDDSQECRKGNRVLEDEPLPLAALLRRQSRYTKVNYSHHYEDTAILEEDASVWLDSLKLVPRTIGRSAAS